MIKGFKGLWLAAVSAAAVVAPAVANAETLAEALAMAYQSNPQLQSQRALQRQTDETYVQARAGFRPTLNATASGSYTETGANDTNRLTGTITASQPLYTGGRVTAAVDAAEATVLAGRQSLRTTEQTVLQAVIQAYQDVLRDQQIVAIRQQSVQVLANQLQDTQARFEAGLLTRTDTARSEANLANTRALLINAQSNLQISRAAYAAVVGQNPGELVAPAPLPNLPKDVTEAFNSAESNNPNLRRAQITEQASRYRVAQVRAQRRPTVSAQASFGAAGQIDPFNLRDYSHNLSVSVNASQPIFTGGVISSQIRAALEQNNSDRILIEQARRQAVQAVSQAWNQLLGAQGTVESTDQSVRAATVAFEGSQEQFRVGLATTLDVLIAQEALRTSQLARVQAARDLYVAQGALLAAMGRLDADSLLQGVPVYDPASSFNRVADSGAVPWEAGIEAIDSVAAARPADPSRPIPAPAAATGPVLKPPTNMPPSADGAFVTTSPTAPATPRAPASLDAPGR